MKPSEFLAIDNIGKQLGAVRALDGVSLKVRSGTIHGIIGHNGSGKSTMVKVLSGVMTPDTGSYRVLKAEETGEGPNGARQAGSPLGGGRRPRVATVFQDLGLADNLSVLDNVLVNAYDVGRLGRINMRRERARVRAAMATLGLDVPLDVEPWRLPEPERVMVCVTRALMQAGVALDGGDSPVGAGVASADVLVLDEPTSSLPRDDLDRFRLLVRRLRDDVGLTALVVTHNPTDIGEMCDEFTALKNGQVMCTLPAQGITTSSLAELMAGKALADSDGESRLRGEAEVRSRLSFRERVFVADDVMTPGLTRPVTLAADQGEFVGLTGLEGSGFREFVAAAMGVKKLSSGCVYVLGEQLTGGPAGLRRAGVIYIPADRARTSGVPPATAFENMTLGQVASYCRKGVLRLKEEKAAVAAMLEELRVFPADPRRILNEMSGGQQQKVVVGRALLSDAELLVFEEPTAAVDVGAREDILRYLRRICLSGNAVLVASVEFEWMPSVCDRVIVFRSGAVVGELLPGEMSEERILSLAYGD